MASARMFATVHGTVQGVGYRWFAQEEAERLGLSGWVRNRADGTVETEAEGERSILERYVERLTEGPSSSRVDRVDVQWSPCEDEYRGFEIR